MRIRIYFDEDAPSSFANALINRGVDVVTTQQTKNLRRSDSEQLLYAAAEKRAIFTHNKRDFILLHKEYLQSGKEHSGIIISDQLPIGLMLKRFMKLWLSFKDTDMENRIEFLSRWK